MSEDSDFSSEAEEANEIDDILAAPPTKKPKKGRRPIDVMRLAPSGSMAIRQEAWQNPRSSIPHDHLDDDFFDNAEEEEEEEEPFDDELNAEDERALVALAQREDREDLPAEPRIDDVPDVPANMPADMMIWAYTRFLHNGGDVENEASFKQTMRDFWDSYIADMLVNHQVPFEPDNRKRKREEDTENYDDFCWMCEYGLGNFDKILSTHAHQMKVLLETHIVCMHPHELARILHTYYRDYVYIPMKKKGKNPPPWTLKMAREHLLVHMRDSRLLMMKLDGRITDSIDLMYDNLFEPHKDDPTRMVHRPEVLRDINNTTTLLIRLRNQKPQNMIGYDPELNIDPKAGSELIRYASLKVEIDNA